MNDIKIGDFITVRYTDTDSYCLYVTDVLLEQTGIIFRENILKEITGIIVEPSLHTYLFKKHKLFLTNTLKEIKKVTDKQKIEELSLKYKIYLLQKS